MSNTNTPQNLSLKEIFALIQARHNILCKDISKYLGISPCTISRWKKSNSCPLFYKKALLYIYSTGKYPY